MHREIYMKFTFIVLVLYTAYKIMTSKTRHKLKHLYNNIVWLVSFIFIIIWSVFILKFNGNSIFYKIDETHLEDYRTATKKAILAFIIAIFAFLEVTIPAYWSVWLAAFFLDEVV